jgi:hypothetical protein
VDDRALFILCATSLVAWRLHPGWLRNPEMRPTVADCINEAYEVFLQVRKFESEV